MDTSSAIAHATELSGRVAKVMGRVPDSDSAVAGPTDANVVFCVAGALVRSLLKQTKCEACRDILVDPTADDLPELAVEDSQSENVGSFLMQVNRGGLYVPSCVAFAICWKAWLVYSAIIKDKDLFAAFLQCEKVRATFVESVLTLLEEI